MVKVKIYVWCNSCSPQWHSAIAMCECGAVVGSHVCSDHYFIGGDMGVDGDKDWSNKRSNQYEPHMIEAHGGSKYVVEYVESADVAAHPGIEAAYQKNQELMRAKTIVDAASPTNVSEGSVTP